MNISIATFKRYLNIIKEILKLRTDVSVFKSIFYSFKFRGRIFVGKNSKLILEDNAQIIIRNNGYLKLGLEYFLPTGATLSIANNGKLILNGAAVIRKDCSVSIRGNAILEMGYHVYIDEQTRIKVLKRVSIGNGTLIGYRCGIIDSDFHAHAEEGVNLNNVSFCDYTKDICIGNNVWIGGNCTILKGVKIGDGTVIGAGSVVSKDIPPKVLAVGNPCKVIKENYQWKA